MKRYPSYKDSGIEWLGEIPEHWSIIRIKRLSPVKRGASPRPIDEPKYFDDNGEFAWVRIADVTASNKYLLKTTQTLSNLGSSLSVKLYPDDLFLSIAGSVGKPIITKIKCCIHDGFVYFPKLRINKDFIYYLFATGQLFQGLGKLGTQLNLNTDTIGNIQIPLPPPEEQKAIAHFIDRKLEEIEHFISNKQRLIELLNEQKTAIINRAVTKGINPDVPMKHSGIECLGEIPEHWQVAPVYSRYHIQLGKMLDTKQITGNYLAFYLRNIDVQWDYINIQDLPKMDFTLEERRRFGLQIGDLLVCEGGESGRTAMWQGQLSECFYQKALHRLRPKQQLDYPRFFYFVMYSATKIGIFIAGSNSNTIDHLTAEKLKKHRCAFPPLDEQILIASYLDKESSKIDQAIAQAEKEIELIQEYRTTLISDAVTGKIDVRPNSLIETTLTA